MRNIINLLCFSIAAVAVSMMFPVRASSQTSEIGLYTPDLRAIRQMSGPTGSLNLPSGDEPSRIAKAWDRLSKKGREFLLREPSLALVVVDSNGKWSYRSTGITTLRPVFSSGERLRSQDADDLGAVLNNYWCRQLRDFYERLLFSNGPYSTGATRNTGSPAAMAYGSFLTQVEREGARKEDKDWLRRIVGYEILGLDENTRETLVSDPIYGTEIAKATAAAEETRRLQLDSVARASSSIRTTQVNIDDIAFILPRQPGDAATLGRFDVSTVNGRKVFSWSNPGGVVFIRTERDREGLPFEFTRENLRGLLKEDKVTAYVSSPAMSEIVEVKASSSPKKP
jgi:hypothetical protein